MYFALCELIATLWDALAEAWASADVRRRLAAWWYVVTHRELLDGPGGGDGLATD